VDEYTELRKKLSEQNKEYKGKDTNATELLQRKMKNDLKE